MNVEKTEATELSDTDLEIAGGVNDGSTNTISVQICHQVVGDTQPDYQTDETAKA